MRIIVNLNTNWQFTKQNSGDASDKNMNDSNWETVQVPHTWNAIDGANGFNYY